MISFELPCNNCKSISYVHESQYCDVCQNYLCENCLDHLTSCKGTCYSLYCNNCGTEEICDNCNSLMIMEIEKYNEQYFLYNYKGVSRLDKYQDWILYKENFIIDYNPYTNPSGLVANTDITSDYTINNLITDTIDIDINFDKMNITKSNCNYCTKYNRENRGICSWGTIHCSDCTEGWVCDCGNYICINCYSEFLNCTCNIYNCPRHLNLLLEACQNCNARYCKNCFELQCPKCNYKI
jgi:hypothetical protein